jgi:mono/diheme cytochrome c family protein
MLKNNTAVMKMLLPIAALGVLGVASLAQSGEQTGDKIFRDNCTKCHAERSPMERTDKEWRVVVTHMRTIAQLTAKEANLVLKYLQENNTD